MKRDYVGTLFSTTKVPPVIHISPLNLSVSQHYRSPALLIQNNFAPRKNENDEHKKINQLSHASSLI